jgi:hypothetical protein
MYTFHPSTWEAEAGRSLVPVQAGIREKERMGLYITSLGRDHNSKF